MNQLNKILLQTHNATGRPLRKIAPLALVAMVVGVALFIAYGLAGTAHVQAESGAIPSLTLDSNEPGQLVINWQVPDPAPTDYRLSWANSSLEFLSYKDSNEAQRGNVYPAGGVITLTLNNLTPGDTYKVQMRSRYYNEDGSGRQSSGPWTATTTQRVKNHPPAAPTSLTTSEVAHDSLILSWDNPQDANITGYRIQRGTDADSLHSIEANTESASTNYTDSTVAADTTYHYAVIALSQDGNGARSITSVTTPAEPKETVQNDPPPAPTGLMAARVGHSVLALTWNDPQDDTITGYRILRGAEADNLSVINSDTGSNATEYEDDTVAPETTYHYAVMALSADGAGPQSSTISATTTAAPKSKDPPPQGVGARQAATTEVSADWSLTPTGLAAGDQFRLLFLSSTKRFGSAPDIATYNTFVQGLAAAGHADIQSYSTGFRVVGCTADTDARDNTSTTYTSTDKGVPIYWLNGAKAADEYEDFYDGDWDDEANDKNESGTDGPDTSQSGNYPITGCNHDGTAAVFGAISLVLGTSHTSGFRLGLPNSSGNGDGPISSFTSLRTTSTRPMYGLSAVFQVAVAANTPAAGAPAVTAPNVFRVPAVLGVDLSGITDADGAMGIATNATYKWQRFAADGTTLDTDSIGTASAYTLTDADATKTLKVVVSFTDDASNSEGPLTSAATSAITAAATDCNAPTLTGGATFIGSARKVGVEKLSFQGLLFYGFSKTLGQGSLDNATFTTAGSNNYEIVSISKLRSEVQVIFDTALSAADQSTLVLHVCDQAYAFGSRSIPSASFTFATPLQDWSSHAERTIYLSQDTVAPTFASATVNGTTLVITFNEPLGAAASLANSAFTVKKNGSATALTYGATAPVISGSTVTLTLATASTVTATDTNVLVTYTKPGTGTANKLVDAFGNETGTFAADQVVTNLLSGTNAPAAGTPAVTAPNVFRVPAVLGVDLSGITDTDGTTGIASNATYKWQRFAANGTTLDTDSIGTDATYTLTDADAGKTLKVVVSYTDDGGNSEGPLTSAATAAITAAASCAAPTLTGGAVFLGPARKVVVGEFNLGAHAYYGFNKADDAGSIDNASFTTADLNNYEILVAATRSRDDWLLVLDAAFPANVQRTLALHFCDEDMGLGSVTPVLSSGNYYYTSDTLLQKWSPHAERTIYVSQDTVAPTFASATVNGTTLVITLSEDLGAAASLANSAFTVKKGPSGSQTTLTLSSTAPVISGSTVTLTLATASSVTATDTNVLVTYTKPTTGTANKLLDAFGNETGTFAADQVVTNLLSGTNTPAAGTPAVTAPNVFRVPAVLGVDLSGITDTDGTTGIASNATYKWQRYAANGTMLDTDSIGTDATYTLTDADAGKTLKVVVSFTDDGGNSEGPLTSAATAAITAAATDCNAPTLTGGATFIGSARKVAVGIFGGGMFYGFSKTLGSGSLDNAAFTSVTSNDYEIVSLGTSNGSVAIQLDQRLSAPDQSTLVMHICDQAYEFRTRSEPAMENPYYLFAMTGQDWSPHAERTIYLSQEPPSVPLVSNLEQTADASATYTRDHGQAFTTGSNSGGYTVTSVTIRTEDPNNDAIPLQICEVDSSTHPTTVCTDLTAPDTFPQNTALVYNAPTSPALTLDADTTYMLVFKAPPSPTALRVGATTSDSEDSTSLAGWSIRNTYQWYNNSNTWADATNARAIRLIITGKANTNTNTPAAGMPAVTAPNVFRVPAVLGVDLSGITDTDGTTGIATNATYKWQRFAADGTTLDTDSIGTDATYTLTDADATKTLKVVVSFTDDGGTSEGPLTSAATSTITAAASCAAPTYVGGATQIWTGKVGVAKHSDFYGYYDHTTLSFGLLDNTRFSISSNNYRVDRVFTQPGPSLALTMNENFTADEQKTLALHICDQAFALSVAGAPSGNTYPFDTTGFPGADLDWSTHAERTIYLSQDTAAPAFASATVNGTSLVITFNEPLGAAASLANSAFTVKKGPSGSQTTLTLSSTAPVISGSTVTLTLATASSVAASDTNVLVTYTKPGTGTANKLVDAFGNETGTFAADQVVTNLLSGTNAPPTVENMIPDQSASADTAFSYTFPDTTFADADSDALTYSATKADGTALPTWLSFAATTRTFSGTPTAAETVSVKVTASDGNGGSVSDTFDITVSAADTTPPTLVSVAVNETGLVIQLRFSENVDRTNLPPASAVTVTADGNALTITGITVPPPSEGLDRHRVLVSPAIQQGQAVVVTYTDPTSGNDTNAFQDIAGNDAATFTTGLNSVPAVTNGSTVAATNTAPTVANIIPDQSATVSTSFSYAFPANTFADADLDTLTYSATKADGTALPMWLTFTAGTRTFSGTPTAAETVSVKVTASDGNGGSVSDTFDITVRTAANTAPTAANATVGTDQDTSYTFTAADFNYSDPDNNPLASVKITTIPAAGKGTLALDGTNIVSAVLPQTVTAAELNTSKLKYNPPANENGTAYTSFEFKVNDGTVDSAGEYTITINVNAVVSGNTPAWGRPTISGTAAVGQTLTASTAGISDPDGLPTTFTFEWSRYASNGTTFEAVVGSNSSTYTLVTGDADKKFQVAVTFTDTEGTDEGPLYSDPYPRIRSAACDRNRGFGFGPAYDIYPGYWCNAGEITIGGTQSGTIQGGFTSNGRYVNDIIDYFELFGITSGNTYQVNLLEPGAGGGHIVGFYRSDSHGLWFDSRGDMQNDAYTSVQLRQALFTPTTNRRYFVGIRGAYATEDITYTVALVAPAADDIPADATSTAFGSGVIEKLYDVDWHKTHRLNSETQYVAYAKGAATNGLFDPFIVGIYDPNGNLIAGTSDRFRGAGRDASVLFTPSTTGRHYIAVSSGPEPFQPRAVRDSSGNGHTGAYVLTITSPNSDNHFRNSTSQRMGPAGSAGGIATVNQEYTFDYALEHDYDEEYVEIAVKPNHIYELYIKETNPWDTAATLRAMPDISYDIYTLADHGCRDSYNSHAVFRTLEFSGTTKDYFVRVRSGTNGGVAGKMAIKLIDTNGDHLDNYANRCD